MGSLPEFRFWDGQDYWQGFTPAKKRWSGREHYCDFFGDNGRIEPRGIHWCYDTGLHVPMIIKWPKSYPAPANYKPGTVKDEVVSLIDLTPTTLGFAGIEKPYGMHGRIFLGNQVGPERTYAFSPATVWMRQSTGCAVSVVKNIIISAITTPTDISLPSTATRKNVFRSNH